MQEIKSQELAQELGITVQWLNRLIKKLRDEIAEETEDSGYQLGRKSEADKRVTVYSPEEAELIKSRIQIRNSETIDTSSEPEWIEGELIDQDEAFINQEITFEVEELNKAIELIQDDTLAIARQTETNLNRFEEASSSSLETRFRMMARRQLQKATAAYQEELNSGLEQIFGEGSTPEAATVSTTEKKKVARKRKET